MQLDLYLRRCTSVLDFQYLKDHRGTRRNWSQKYLLIPTNTTKAPALVLLTLLIWSGIFNSSYVRPIYAFDRSSWLWSGWCHSWLSIPSNALFTVGTERLWKLPLLLGLLLSIFRFLFFFFLSLLFKGFTLQSALVNTPCLMKFEANIYYQLLPMTRISY